MAGKRGRGYPSQNTYADVLAGRSYPAMPTRPPTIPHASAPLPHPQGAQQPPQPPASQSTLPPARQIKQDTAGGEQETDKTPVVAPDLVNARVLGARLGGAPIGGYLFIGDMIEVDGAYVRGVSFYPADHQLPSGDAFRNAAPRFESPIGGESSIGSLRPYIYGINTSTRKYASSKWRLTGSLVPRPSPAHHKAFELDGPCGSVRRRDSEVIVHHSWNKWFGGKVVKSSKLGTVAMIDLLGITPAQLSALQGERLDIVLDSLTQYAPANASDTLTRWEPSVGDSQHAYITRAGTLAVVAAAYGNDSAMATIIATRPHPVIADVAAFGSQAQLLKPVIVALALPLMLPRLTQDKVTSECLTTATAERIISVCAATHLVVAVLKQNLGSSKSPKPGVNLDELLKEAKKIQEQIPSEERKISIELKVANYGLLAGLVLAGVARYAKECANAVSERKKTIENALRSFVGILTTIPAVATAPPAVAIVPAAVDLLFAPLITKIVNTLITKPRWGEQLVAVVTAEEMDAFRSTTGNDRVLMEQYFKQLKGALNIAVYAYPDYDMLAKAWSTPDRFAAWHRFTGRCATLGQWIS